MLCSCSFVEAIAENGVFTPLPLDLLKPGFQGWLPIETALIQTSILPTSPLVRKARKESTKGSPVHDVHACTNSSKTVSYIIYIFIHIVILMAAARPKRLPSCRASVAPCFGRLSPNNWISIYIYIYVLAIVFRPPGYKTSGQSWHGGEYLEQSEQARQGEHTNGSFQ